MKKELFELLKPFEQRLDLILNHNQHCEPSDKTNKILLKAQIEMWPDEKPCCETCIDCFTDKVKTIAIEYFKAKEEFETFDETKTTTLKKK